MASTPRIDELRKKFEENPRRYFAPLANEYRKAGQVEQAIAICREYLPQQPGHMSGHIVYGQALYEARQFDEAKAVFETALSLDPENLIALRHLGDISLIVNDADGARNWYRRVLDADPRNEEIQAQLATLDQAGGAPATPTPVVNESVPQTPVRKATPSSAPTMVISAVPRPGAAAKPVAPVGQPPETVTPESPTAEIRLDDIPTQAPPKTESLSVQPTVEVPAPPLPVTGMALGFEPTSVGTAEPATPAPSLYIDAPVSASQAEPPLGSFSLEGLETTSFVPPASAPAVQAPLDLDFLAPAAPPPAASSAPPPLPDLDFGTVSAPAPKAAPEPTPIPMLEFAAPEASPPAGGADQELPLLDLSDLPAAPALEIWTPPPTPEATGAPDVLPAVPASGPFVTETMAELYLQQGHREEALRVYRALLDQRPSDPSLQSKVASLEAALRPVPAWSAPRAGPTIRELLNVIALRRPGFRPESPRQNGATPATSEALQPRVMPSTTRSAGSAPDALTALFGGGKVSQSDESAALALASAFAEINGDRGPSAIAPASLEISGAPARRASTDLSLDTVFGSHTAKAAASNFSFDQFFSQRATSEQAGSGSAKDSSSELRDDVAQFTQWLEGLKRR